MDGRIAHLRNHYRIYGAGATVAGVASRLDRVLREDVVKCFEEALQGALPDEESIYVLRRVETCMTLMLSEGATDIALAKAWGRHLAGAVVRAIANGEYDSANLVRFENQADYLAHFLVALLKGDQRQWFFNGLANFTALDRVSAIGRVLLEHREQLPAVLSYVHRYGAFDSLIASLDAETKRALWDFESDQPHNLEAERSLFLVALQFVDGLEGWARIPRDGEHLFRDYLETATAPADWQDPRSLTCAVFDVVRFLLLRGYLARQESTSVDFHARLNKTLQRFAWLDREWLRSALIELFDTNEQKPAALPVPMVSGRATPRQRELISTLSDLLAGARAVDTADPIAAALKLLTLLVTEQPHWADDAGAKAMIQNVIAAQAAMGVASAPGEFLRLLRSGDVEGALRLLPAEQRERARGALRFVSRLGEPAVAVVEKLTPPEQQPATANYVNSNCAGLSLLIRTVLDARWHALPEDAYYFPKGDWPRPVMLFLMVALRIAGEAAVVDGRVDEGLCLLAGLKDQLTLDSLRSHCLEAENEELAKFQNALLRIAAGHRLFSPATMHVFEAHLGAGKRAIVAGEAAGNVWLLSRLIETDADAQTAVLDWQAEWEEATGIKPRVVADGAALGMLLSGGQNIALRPEDEETQASHDKGQRALREAFEILDQGKMDQANLDLAVFIAACILLRMWARWLRGFASAGTGFLIENFISRSGRLLAQRDGLVVELDRGPLDIVIEMAGCLDELDRVPWLPGGRIRFQLRGA